MFRVYISGASGAMQRRTVHPNPNDALAAYTVLCDERTDQAAAAHMVGPALGGGTATVLLRYRLDREWLAPRLEIYAVPPGVPRGRLLPLLRRGTDLTQETLAERMAVDRVTIARWETGEREMSEAYWRLAQSVINAPK